MQIAPADWHGRCRAPGQYGVDDRNRTGIDGVTFRSFWPLNYAHGFWTECRGASSHAPISLIAPYMIPMRGYLPVRSLASRGFEPPISELKARCLNPFWPRRRNLPEWDLNRTFSDSKSDVLPLDDQGIGNGCTDRIRTCDLPVNSRSFCQLNYCALAEAEGLEPPTLLQATVFETASSSSRVASVEGDMAVARSLVCVQEMEPLTGVEPATRCLQGSRSTS